MSKTYPVMFGVQLEIIISWVIVLISNDSMHLCQIGRKTSVMFMAVLNPNPLVSCAWEKEVF